MLNLIIFLCLGFALLILGADFLVKGASGIAKKFNISEIIIGLTIVSLGTSLPELIVTIVSSISGNTDLIVGNVLGSNICNLLLVLGCLAFIKPFQFENSSINFHLPLLITINIFLILIELIISYYHLVFLNQYIGALLLLIALLYFLVPIFAHIKSKSIAMPSNELNALDTSIHTSSTTKDIHIFSCFVFIIIGSIGLKYGGDFVVDSATSIGHLLHINETVIGLTMIAIGTSLPELVTSIVAVLKKDEDIAEGNIIGSCIINFCLILGTGMIMSHLSITIDYFKQLYLLLFSTILIYFLVLINKNSSISRIFGVLLIYIYVLINITLFV